MLLTEESTQICMINPDMPQNESTTFVTIYVHDAER